jgi:uncharacterized membrane protein (DUF4010 family)
MDPTWINYFVALGIGLLIGLERERSKGEGPARGPAGIRTFALASLLGAAAIELGGVPLLAIAVAAAALLTALSYWRTRESDPGLTTEIGLVIVPILGALAMSDPLFAAGLGAAVAVIFAAKAPLHGLAKGVLSDAEIRDGLLFAIATLVVWPQLPDRSFGPFSVFNPHRVWLVVILVLAIGAAGHAALRILGRRKGLPLVGLAAGFVSSTAAIGSMAGRAARDPSTLNAAVAGGMFSTVATFVQMSVLLSTVSPGTFVLLAPGLLAGGLVAAAYAAAFVLRSSPSTEPVSDSPGRAFSLGAALGLAALVTGMSILTAALKQWLGTPGVSVGVAVAGIVDAHAAGVSVATLVATNALDARDAVVPILAAMSSNALSKIAMAITFGSRDFVRLAAPGIVVSMAATWGVAWAMAQG